MFFIQQKDFHTFPLLAFKTDEKSIEEIEKMLEDESLEQEKEERVILCRNCKYKITSFEDIMEVEGRHMHIFSNPEGIVFQIGCFSSADGCVNRGVPTTEFTWFAGFSWRFSFCSNCYMHLGWFYQSRGTENFYGLILDRLAESI
ncbi:MAG: hypothetical protein GY749_16465 [Desulfobacteraceae bacterium]|nr:hypothetical protein [Desulfobacteraceae bacterium]